MRSVFLALCLFGALVAAAAEPPVPTYYLEAREATHRRHHAKNKKKHHHHKHKAAAKTPAAAVSVAPVPAVPVSAAAVHKLYHVANNSTRSRCKPKAKAVKAAAAKAKTSMTLTGLAPPAPAPQTPPATIATPVAAAVTPAKAPALASPANTWTAASPAAQATPSAAAQAAVNNVAASGATAFQGALSGIGSWFRSNNPQDSTNGHSWCQFPYADSSPIFAPSLHAMLSSAGGDANKAGQMYCGLQATVTNPMNGKSMTMYIGDAFDDTWVRTPDSIDIMTGAFNQLYGGDITNKDTVIQGVQWTLTGQRSSQYSFGGPGE